MIVARAFRGLIIIAHGLAIVLAREIINTFSLSLMLLHF
jgi:hypothetical protein